MQPNTTKEAPIIKAMYEALLTQSGTNAPTAIVLQNTFETPITLEYETTGSYFIKSTQEFPENKTVIEFGTPTTINTGNATIQGAFRIDSETINIVTYLLQTGVPSLTRQNDRLTTTKITIKTYR